MSADYSKKDLNYNNRKQIVGYWKLKKNKKMTLFIQIKQSKCDFKNIIVDIKIHLYT